MEILNGFLTVVYVFACLFLGFVVLIQKGEGGGLGRLQTLADGFRVDGNASEVIGPPGLGFLSPLPRRVGLLRFAVSRRVAAAGVGNPYGAEPAAHYHLFFLVFVLELHLA